MIAMRTYTQPISIMNKIGLRLIVLLGGMLLLGIQDVSATHIVGGNLTYRCLGNNLYELRLTVRRDCLNGAPNAQFDDPASIGFFDAVTNQLLTFPGVPDGQILIPVNNNDTLNEVLVSDCSVIAGDVCVHTTTYIATVALPFHPNGYLLAYQRCCRNQTLNNVLDPLNTGMTLVAELSPLAQQQCNSSPQFRAFPPIYTCVNKELVYDHSAVDPEGDSLVYSLCTPNAGATNTVNQPQPPMPPPFPLVIFRPPYNLSNLMGGIPLTINPQTGELRGTPNTIGQFVVGICVEAYRNGQLTGVTRRDFQLNVRQCRDVPVALFEAPDLTCNNLTVNFDNQSQLADEYTWIFNYGSANEVRDTSAEPNFTFPEGNFFQVALIANDQDSFCFDTIVQTIGVFDSQIVPDFEADVPDCMDSITLELNDQSTGFDPGFPAVSWEWILTVCQNVLDIPPGQNTSITFNVDEECTALVGLIVTSSNGCSATTTQSFPVQEIEIPINPNADSICRGDTVQLLINAEEGFNYSWEPFPFNGMSISDPCAPHDPCAYPGISATYYVTVTHGLCEKSDSIHVEVQQLPTIDFEDTTDCKSLVVMFENLSMNGDLYHWDFGDGDSLVVGEDVNPSHTYDTAGTYIVTLSSRDGCDVSLSQTITSNALASTVDDNTVNCFLDSISLNPNANTNLDYIWSPGNFLDDPTADNPTAGGIQNDTEFFVTITQAGLEGCEIYDSITVLVPDAFTVSAPDDIVSCRFDTIELAGTITGNLNLDYVWMNSNGDIISTDSFVVINTGEPDTFKLTATDSLGCSKSDIVIIRKPDDLFSVEPCFNTLAYCDIQTITLCATSIDGVTFEWFNAEGVLIGQGDSIQVTPGSPACYQVIGTEPLGCQADGIVCLTPTFFDLDISNTQHICLGESIEICVTDNNNQDLDYLWSPTADDTGCITVSPADTTLYTVTVTNNLVGCTDTLSTEVVVDLFEPFDIIVTYEPDTIYETLPLHLFVNQNPGFEYVWSTTAGETPDNVWNPTVPAPPGPVTYTVTVTNEAGCTAVGSVTIGVRSPLCDDSDVFLPTAFTPNGDGVNDELRVYTVYPLQFELHIYNRWGQEVFSTLDQNDFWDGRFNGERLPPDVFGFYMNVTCPNEAKFFKKGNITLLD
jgi:gliding motility-associated-like protein